MRNVPAALIVVLFVFPLFFAGLLAVGVSTWALDRNFYASLISDIRLYQVPDGLSAATRVSVDLPGRPRLSMNVSPRALKEILPADHVRSQALMVLGSAFDFIDGKTAVFDPVIDLTPVKAALKGPAGRRFARIVAQDLPAGAPGTQFAVGPGTLPDSRPSNLSVERAAAIIEGGLPAFARAIPDKVRLNDVAGAGGELVRGQSWSGFTALNGLIMADVLLLFTAAAFWVAAAFIGGGNARRRLQWLGWSLLAPAVVVFLSGFFVTAGFVSEAVRSGLAAARLEGAAFAPGFAAAVSEAVRTAMQRIGISFIVTGAVAAGVSLSLLGVSWSLPRERTAAP